MEVAEHARGRLGLLAPKWMPPSSAMSGLRISPTCCRADRCEASSRKPSRRDDKRRPCNLSSHDAKPQAARRRTEQVSTAQPVPAAACGFATFAATRIVLRGSILRENRRVCQYSPPPMPAIALSAKHTNSRFLNPCQISTCDQFYGIPLDVTRHLSTINTIVHYNQFRERGGRLVAGTRAP